MNSKTKALRRNYDKLEPLERFRLAVAAYERNDENELQAIRSTAPKATYTMTAWPYRGMWDAIVTVAWVTITDILRAGIFMLWGWGLENAREVIYALAGPDDEEPDEEPNTDGPRSWDLMIQSARKVIATWDALGLFCDDLGITLSQALKFVPPASIAESVVDFARTVLGLDEDFCLYLATEVCEKESDELTAIMAKRAERIAERLQAMARERADLLHQIWETKIG